MRPWQCGTHSATLTSHQALAVLAAHGCLAGITVAAQPTPSSAICERPSRAHRTQHFNAYNKGVGPDTSSMPAGMHCCSVGISYSRAMPNSRLPLPPHSIPAPLYKQAPHACSSCQAPHAPHVVTYVLVSNRDNQASCLPHVHQPWAGVMYKACSSATTAAARSPRQNSTAPRGSPPAPSRPLPCWQRLLPGASRSAA